MVKYTKIKTPIVGAKVIFTANVVHSGYTDKLGVGKIGTIIKIVKNHNYPYKIALENGYEFGYSFKREWFEVI